jgi:hypothetical protein
MKDGSAPVPLGLGTRTPWGKVALIQSRQGERYYMLTKGRQQVAYMPAVVVESAVRDRSTPMPRRSAGASERGARA